MAISLPTGETNKGTNDWSDVYGNDKALKEAGESLEGKFPVTNANLSGEIEAGKLKGEVPDTKLASPNNSVYRSLFTNIGSLSNGVAAGTYFVVEPSEVASGITSPVAEILSGFKANNGRFPTLFNLAAADYTVAGKTAKLQLRGAVLVNGTKPTMKFTIGLYPITVEGAEKELKIVLGTLATGSGVEVNEPAANTVTRAATSADFVLPSDGLYAFGVVTSATLTAKSAVLIHAELQARNV